jgi:hypothetical protein
MNYAIRGLLLLTVASFLPGCGGSAAQGPTAESQQKVKDASRDIAGKFADSSKRAPTKSMPVFRPQ